MISYILLFVILSSVMVSYLVLAKKMGLIDNPNERSSHKKPTVRGGGVIFPIAVVAWAFFFEHGDWYFVLAVILIGLIGFLDDRYTLSPLPRFIIQSLGVFLIMLELDLLSMTFIYIVIAFILMTGWLNTFNFMDGINGITVLYTLVVLFGVYLFREEVMSFSLSLFYTLVIALSIFGFLNVRINAVAFAGDVGSLSMGLILAYLVSSLIISTGRWEFILLVSVYGVDSVLTITHRILKKENIFEAHRSHLYQFMANECKWGHIPVAVFYSTIQVLIIIGLRWLNIDLWKLYSIFVLLLLVAGYMLSKSIIIKMLSNNN
ncbi:MAG: UDP-GlcNAc--UDP-phosphate GlcNAc-1-phosphate transferase [bacterium]|nr:UDP-GlcNAc--UDP-phosphate GlcNAc-1-phosphate transferase [bacterium]